MLLRVSLCLYVACVGVFACSSGECACASPCGAVFLLCRVYCNYIIVHSASVNTASTHLDTATVYTQSTLYRAHHIEITHTQPPTHPEACRATATRVTCAADTRQHESGKNCGAESSSAIIFMTQCVWRCVGGCVCCVTMCVSELAQRDDDDTAPT